MEIRVKGATFILGQIRGSFGRTEVPRRRNNVASGSLAPDPGREIVLYRAA